MTRPSSPPRNRALYSPPKTPFSGREWRVVPPDDLGMVGDSDLSPERSPTKPKLQKEQSRRVRQPRRQWTYVSRHFVGQPVTPKLSKRDSTKSSKGPVKKDGHLRTRDGKSVGVQDGEQEQDSLATPPETPGPPERKSPYSVNIDEWSSDSTLTDVPDDIGPDPFIQDSPVKADLPAPKDKTNVEKRPTKSPYFRRPHKHRATFLATLPFPPISHSTFGLMQERLARDPFRLLIATIFLNKTPGARAMPVFYELMSHYPTPSDLSKADVADVTKIIHVLGFQNQRARKCVSMAKVWVERPPQYGQRYRKMNYPGKGDGRDVKEGECINDEDERVAWEISHLPGLGPYSHDSWRMFCRDMLRNKASGWNGEGAQQEGFEPEWKRVVPLDKELRAWLTWMWMKEGWVWNKETGKRIKASDELMEKARGGGVVVEQQDSEHLEIHTVSSEQVTGLQEKNQVEHTAGDYLPGG